MLKITTYLEDIFKRLTKYDNKLNIYKNGEDNAYPERMDRYINNSVTAKMGKQIMTQYLLGKGFGESDETIINTETKQTLIDFSKDVAESLVQNRGLAIHFNYKILDDLEVVPVNPTVIPFENVRLGKKDDREYNAKILVSKEWNKKTYNKIEYTEYYVFNDNKKVIQEQIKHCKGIENYKGQILYINYDKKYYYPLSRIDSVQNDCDSEAQASIYKNRLLRKGFFGKTLIILPPLIEEDVEEYKHPTEEVIRTEGYKRYFEQKSEAEKIKLELEKFIGAENSDGTMVVEMPIQEFEIDKILKVEKIDNTIDDKIFEYTENSVSKNILMAFNNIPVVLVKSPDSAFFGNSGEALKEAKKSYWQNTNNERSKFVMIINDVLRKLNINITVNVINLLDDSTNINNQPTTN